MKTQALLSAVLALVTFLGCSKTSESQTKHELGQTARFELAPFLWTEVNEAEFQSVVAPAMTLYLAPKGHEVTARIQYWLDTIDAAIRKNARASLAHIPKPFAVLTADDLRNAFVSGMPVCLAVKSSIAKGQNASSPAHAFMVYGDEITTLEKPQCLERSELARDIEKIIKAVNSNLSTECQLKLVKNEVELNPLCKSYANEVTHASHFAFVTQPNFLIVSSSLMARIDDEHEFATVVAHELAHYYHGHLLSSQAGYNFPYVEGVANQGRKPQPEPSLTPLLEKMRALKWDVFTEFPGQKFSGALHRRMAGLTPLANSETHLRDAMRSQCKADDDACAKACKTFFEMSDVQDASSIAPSLGDFSPFEYALMPARAHAHIAAFENAFERCAIVVKVESADAALSEAALLKGLEVHEHVAAPNEASARTVLDVLNKATARIRHSRYVAQELYEEAARKRLSFYTKEQEADEVALEYLHLIKVKPASVIDGFIHLGSVFTSDQEDAFVAKLRQSVTGEINSTYCRVLHKWGFEDAPDVSLPVPLGEFADEHHSPCFRAFRLHKEALAHKFTQTEPTKAPPGHDWTYIQFLAAKLTKEATTDGEEN